jgi:hypothetical protein
MSKLFLPDGAAAQHDPQAMLRMQQQAMAQEMAMARAARLTAMASAYFEKTGLKPEEARLVERIINCRGQVIIEWTFEKKKPLGEGETVISEESMPAPGTPLGPDNPAPPEECQEPTVITVEAEPVNSVEPHPDPVVEKPVA